jgi:putative CocE/NonD family hydrolase
MNDHSVTPSKGKFPFKRLIFFLGIIISMGFQNCFASEKISLLGKYQGYSEEIYDDYVRTSDYLKLSDGTRLAYDLLLPSNEQEVSRHSFPVLFCYTSYLRAYNMVVDGKVVDNEIVNLNMAAKAFIWLRAKLVKNGHIFDQAFMNKWVKRMVKHGYAVVIVEQRGTGASEGTMVPIFKYQADDMNEIMNWIADQPWSDGNIGMFGKSSLAMAQYAAASAGNPHLKAIFPVSSSIDMYSAVWFPGGIFNSAFSKVFASSTGLLEKMAVPVDSDTDGSDLQKVLKHRRESFSFNEGPEKGIKNAPFRDSDSAHPKGGKIWEDLGIYTLLKRINQTKTAIYNESGWFDIFLRDSTLLHNNLTGSRKLLIRPLSHFALGKKSKDLDTDAEAHRWFDYWLKGVENGIMDEPPIHYYVMGSTEEKAWQSTSKWPLQHEKRTRLYFSASATHSPGSAGKKLLTFEPPSSSDDFDNYRINYDATTWKHSRWSSVIQEIDYPDMSENDRKSLAYTTRPLEENMEITGHPVIHLVVSAQVTDLDFFAYLEEVDDDGQSKYITEGCLRATHRALGETQFLHSELPMHRSYKEDMTRLIPDTPAELVFDLLPTSYVFRKGCRIRITIACSDLDNFETPRLDPAPEVRVFKNRSHASFIELPIIL